MIRDIDEFSFEEPVNTKKGAVMVKALCQKDGTFVAVKFISRDLIDKIPKSQIERVMAQFELIHHRNIVKVRRSIMKPVGLFIVSDYCNDNSLASKVDQCGCFSEKLVAKFTAQILLALDYLHVHHCSHNNLRASNVLLHDGIVKLADFGVPALVRANKVIFCPYWTAPEVLVSNEYSTKSDVWSLGCTIIELLTGRPPNTQFSPEEARFKILNQMPSLPDGISTELIEFLNLCFIHDKDERPSIKDLAKLKWLHLFEADEEIKLALESLLMNQPAPLIQLPISNSPQKKSSMEELFDDAEEENFTTISLAAHLKKPVAEINKKESKIPRLQKSPRKTTKKTLHELIAKCQGSEKEHIQRRKKFEENQRKFLNEISKELPDLSIINSLLDFDISLKSNPSIGSLILTMFSKFDLYCSNEPLFVQVLSRLCLKDSNNRDSLLLAGGINFLIGKLNCSLVQEMILEFCNSSQEFTEVFLGCSGLNELSKIDESSLSFLVRLLAIIFEQRKGSQCIDFYHMLLDSDLINSLSTAFLHQIPDEMTIIADMFDKLSQSDSTIRIELSQKPIISSIITILSLSDQTILKKGLDINIFVSLSNCLKQIAMEPSTRNDLAKEKAISITSQMLKNYYGKVTQQIHANLLTFLIEMGKLSVERIEQIAENGILPFLQEQIQKDSCLKVQCLAIVMELFLSKVYLPSLINDGLVQIYLNNITSSFWNVKSMKALDSIVMENDTYSVLPILYDEKSISQFKLSLQGLTNQNCAPFLKSYTNLIKKSNLSSKIVDDEFASKIVDLFQIPSISSQTALSLLEFVQSLLIKDSSLVKHFNSDTISHILSSYHQSQNYRQKLLASNIIRVFQSEKT